ncbi:hypothetical protein BH11PSE8_BH11PSE8_00770 [soil metagenome]
MPSTTPSAPSRGRAWLTALLPLVVGAVSLAVTGWLWSHERQNEAAQLRASFDFGLRQTTSRIEQRMAGYEQLLRGVQGLFEASGTVDRQSFAAYADAVLVGSDIAGLQSIAYAPVLAADGLAAHVAAVRANGFQHYDVRPAGERPLHAPITYIAPLVMVNQMAMGFDPLGEAVRRNAMLQARDSGGAAITGKIDLITEASAHPQAGFLMILPLYRQGIAVGSVDARRAQSTGWVWAAMRVGDLMAGLYGEGTPGLEVRIYDGVTLADSALMYRSSAAHATGADRAATAAAQAEAVPRFEAQEYIGFHGHTWTLRVRTLPEFEVLNAQGVARVIAAAGTAFSLLLAMLTYQLVNGRARAFDTARLMTRELRDSEERYRRIVETANEGIWLIDADARITFANPTMQRMLGYSEAELLGRPIADFVSDHDGLAAPLPACGGVPANATSAASASTATAGRRELGIRRQDGSALWVSLSVSTILDDTGRFAGALGMCTDITDQRGAEARRTLLEAQLRESQKMEAIGTLAGGIAHDFNNILAAILGNVAAARRELPPQGGVPVAANLDQIDKAAVRARTLVQQILAFSRMQPHVMVCQALRPLIEEAITLLRATLPAQVELRVELTEEALFVDADATQIQQVLMNLCTNAWHALHGSRGRIDIGLESTVIDTEAAQRLGELHAGAHAHLWVADTGSGMDEATRARVFEPFFTTKRVGLGTGLGLSVVHGIVTTHAGAVSVESTPGRGSTFHLYLPLQAEPAIARPTPSTAAASSPQGQGQHVMYVDDDPAMLLIVERLLVRAGYRVTALERPAEALAMLTAQPGEFDVLVTDYNMPELTGLDIATEIAQLQPELPVLITSGYISEEMRAEAAHVGVRSLLQKEFTLERLAALVHAVLAEVTEEKRKFRTIDNG